VVQKLESTILLYFEHMEESNLKEGNWSGSGESTEIRKGEREGYGMSTGGLYFRKYFNDMSLDCNVFWKYIHCFIMWT